MINTFTKPLAGIRMAPTRRGDTIQIIAARELGDAALWYDLAELNDLIAPWVTDDPTLAGPRVHLAGTPMLVPASGRDASGVAAEDADLLGTDIELRQGLIEADENGDIAIVTGQANLRQAIRHRIETHRGELVFHQDYGCDIHQLLGAKGDDIANALGAMFVDRAVRADPRVRAMQGTTAVIAGDALEVTATAITVDGKRVPIGSR